MLSNAGRLPSWTRQVLKTSGDYVGTPVAYSNAAGIRYELFYACKAHDCADNAMELMFAPNSNRAWATLMEDDVADVLGGGWTAGAHTGRQHGRHRGGLGLQPGRIVRGSWSRGSLTSVTSYKDAKGATITLHPGKTWVELVPVGIVPSVVP